MSEAPKKKGWEYAQEALAVKRAGNKARTAAAPKNLQVKGEKLIVKPQKLEVSTPDVDFNAPVIPVKLIKRAGVKTYAGELKERLLDVDEAPEGAYFLLPLKLPKRVFKMLVEASLIMSEVNPEWTERDTLEALMLFSDVGVLTKVKNRA